jgi:hypothetical protein
LNTGNKTSGASRSDTPKLGSDVERLAVQHLSLMLMKTFLKFASCLAVLATWPALNSKAADISVFYDQLDPYGEWVEVGDYGYCWHPRDTDSDWRPYTTGNWAYTDAGWTWVSDEPYGWAVYHYGRWTRVERVGWVWVPDTEWAPAWVSWRHSDRYVGWAPLPPESRARIGVSLGGWVDAAFDIGPTYYSFVEVRDLGAPRLRSVLVPSRENITIINQTTNITNITYRNNVVINNGPDYNVVSREAAQPIRRLKLERREQAADLRTARVEQLSAKVQGESLVVSAPAIEKAPDAKPKKVAQKLDKASVDRGWKNAGDAKQVETARAKFKEEAKGAPADATPGTAARDRAPAAAPADTTTAPPESKRPPTTAETTEQKPGTEPTAKPGREKGKAGEGRRTAGQPKVGSPNAPTTTPPVADENAPAKVATPGQPGVAGETDQPDRAGKQRGKKGQAPAKSPDAIAEDLKKPVEPQPDVKPPQPDAQPQGNRAPDRRPAVDASRPERGAPEELKDRPARPEGRERQPSPDRPGAPGNIDRPARPEPRNVPEQAERAVRERAPGAPAREVDAAREAVRERGPQPNAQPQRPPQPDAAGHGPAEGKGEGIGEGKKKKKDDRVPE